MTGKLSEKVLKGDTVATARVLRLIDDGLPEAREIMKKLYPHTGKAHIIGVTGAPGAGKSTLVTKLIGLYRRDNLKVGIIAVDPTSPFTGGAILGDRIRMQDHGTDPEVFIRSVATRGHLGGLSKSAWEMAKVLDAMGKDKIIVETVGVGQDEVEIIGLAHTSVVMLVPGLGDDIQAIKAGILEIADIFVVNKADRPETNRMVRDLEVLLEMAGLKEREWTPPIIKTIATRGKGIEEIREAIENHHEYLKRSGKLEEKIKAQREKELQNIIMEMLREKIFSRIDKEKMDKLIEDIASNHKDPYSIAEEILSSILN